MNRTLLSYQLKSLGIALCLLIAGSVVFGQEKKPDVWQPVRFLVGEWDGTSDGQAGSGTVQRSYSFVLKDRYIYEKNISTYPPSEKQKGEVHEHWSFVSYDRNRKTLVLRQFHQEGFINQYVLNASASSSSKLVFDSEQFENFSNDWKARETYDILSPDEFIETFELAEPGKEMQVYSKNHLKRKDQNP